MDIAKLRQVAKQMVAPGKGILAADESGATTEKRFSKVGIPNTEDNRRAYRELFFTTPGIGTYISGVILHDETIRQKASTGQSFVMMLEAEDILPGIKVDQGLYDMEGSPEEKLTKGLEGLDIRLEEYARLGAKFAKWRSVITVLPAAGVGYSGPTDQNIRQNAKDLAAYAKACQNAGIVPMVEPEVLMDGGHSMADCASASEKILAALFEELKNAGVDIEGVILKTNMAVPGKESGEKMDSVKVADATLAVFNKVLPANLPGQAFLSGGQSEIEATENLNEMNKRGAHPWPLTFSYARALQSTALTTWLGKPENVSTAQAAFVKRAEMNSLAALGKYQGELAA
jgi:fructose-bisphosphate aldolase, class I